MTFITTLLNEGAEVRALAMAIGVSYAEAEQLFLEGNYLVLTEEGREYSAYAYINESLWAFDYEFLAQFSEVIDAIRSDVWAYMVRTMRGDFNEVILAALCHDTEEVCEAAVERDGYGHYLGIYDGQEIEQEVNGNTYYIYRVD